MSWALPEWTVLAALREQPRHGFAIAALTGVDGELGRVWAIPRPVIYRALGRLAKERTDLTGFDAVLMTWRHTNAVAALHFLDELT